MGRNGCRGVRAQRLKAWGQKHNVTRNKQFPLAVAFGGRLEKSRRRGKKNQ